jgi:hypothetical protein
MEVGGLKNNNFLPCGCSSNLIGPAYRLGVFEVVEKLLLSTFFNKLPFLASEECFWPLTAFMRSEVKNDRAHVITQGICNKFNKVNFFVGCMVSQPNCPFQDPKYI